MKTKADPKQGELALTAVMSHTLFPGRAFLMASEVAAALNCTLKHVLHLVEEGRLTAVNAASRTDANYRRTLRIPVSAYDKFIEESKT